MLCFGPESDVPSPKWADGVCADRDFGQELASRIGPDGFPRNPAGRTGLRGRGVLGCWGPNQAEHYLIYRLKRNVNGTPMERSQMPVYEFFLCQREDGMMVLPGGYDSDPYTVRNNETLAMLLRLGTAPPRKSSYRKRSVGAFGPHGSPVGGGGGGGDGGDSCDAVPPPLHQTLSNAPKFAFQSVDEKDTDNAWVEQTFRILDLSNRITEAIPGHVADQEWSFDWVTLQHGIKLAYRSQSEALMFFARKHGAFW